MKAKRAKEIATRANGEMPFDKVLKQVYEAAASGVFKTSVQVNSIQDEVVRLKSLGYSVDRFGSHYGDSYILVSW